MKTRTATPARRSFPPAVTDPQGGYGQGFTFVGYSDQGGRPDGNQVMVHNGCAYIGQGFNAGVTVLDVRDPRQVRPAAFIPALPNTWNIHLQTHGDLLLVIDAINFFQFVTDEGQYYSTPSAGLDVSKFGVNGVDYSAGMRVYDISRPTEPREIAFMPVRGAGLHRIWYDGGRYAYASALLEGYSDYILLIIDMADPTKPVEAGRWWLPGMWPAGGEEPRSELGRVGLHHAIVADGLAFGAWRDAGLAVVDVHDPARPTMVAERNWSPPFMGGTHTTLPLLDRDLLVVADEAVADNCEDGAKHIWLFDVRERGNPVSVATVPVPSDEDFCGQPGHFGPHNLHENRSGAFQSSDIIFATYQNAGVRAFDISDPLRPNATGHYLPGLPQRTRDTRVGAQLPVTRHSADVFVDTEGLTYVTDYNGGLNILQYEGI
jgi:hypothetical protein